MIFSTKTTTVPSRDTVTSNDKQMLQLKTTKIILTLAKKNLIYFCTQRDILVEYIIIASFACDCVDIKSNFLTRCL